MLTGKELWICERKLTPLLTILSSYIMQKHLVPFISRHIMMHVHGVYWHVPNQHYNTTQHSCSQLSANTLFISLFYIINPAHIEGGVSICTTCDCTSALHMIHHSVFWMWENSTEGDTSQQSNNHMPKHHLTLEMYSFLLRYNINICIIFNRL